MRNKKEIIVIVFTALFFSGLRVHKVFANQNFTLDCPCDGDNVTCSNGSWCPSGYKKYENGDGILSCDAGFGCHGEKSCCSAGTRCCFKESMGGCPTYSSCFIEPPTQGWFYYHDIGKTCITNGERGKCWVLKPLGLDECLPVPDECNSGACGVGSACRKNSYGGSMYFTCVPDAKCGPCSGCCGKTAEDCGSGYTHTSGRCPISGEQCFVKDPPSCTSLGGTCRFGDCHDDEEIYPYLADCPMQSYFCCVKVGEACGFEGKPCCSDSTCRWTFLVCGADNVCHSSTCGGDGEICCPPNLCDNPDLECIDVNGGTCVKIYTGPPKGPIYNGPIIDSLEKILNPAVRVLYYGGLFVGIFFIILSGYKLMTSEGDPQRTKEAQEQLTSAIIGIIFILLSTTIIRIIFSQIIGI
jgi:hypothetical protein